MHSSFAASLLMLTLFASPPIWSQAAKEQSIPTPPASSNPQSLTKVPKGVILVKGAWSSASDSVTPLPEDSTVTNHVFHNQYFGITFPLPSGWAEKYKGPPPSESGRYVLAELAPADAAKASASASILITAQDLFFTPLPVASATELVDYTQHHLQSDYRIEAPPHPTTIAARDFTFFSYWSPVAELHWYVLTTQLRCHALQFVLSSRDRHTLDSLLLDLNKMNFASLDHDSPAAVVPVCLKDYATAENVIARVDPVFTENKSNSIPVRIIIGPSGKVKHIHFLSAFPGQAKAISDALSQWTFKPYLQNFHPSEVETGLTFGRAPTHALPKTPPTH
jgi:hypothetical protein